METYIKVEASHIMLLPGDQYYRAVDRSVKDSDEADLFNCEGILPVVVYFLREKILYDSVSL